MELSRAREPRVRRGSTPPALFAQAVLGRTIRPDFVGTEPWHAASTTCFVIVRHLGVSSTRKRGGSTRVALFLVDVSSCRGGMTQHRRSPREAFFGTCLSAGNTRVAVTQDGALVYWDLMHRAKVCRFGSGLAHCPAAPSHGPHTQPVPLAARAKHR